MHRPAVASLVIVLFIFTSQVSADHPQRDTFQGYTFDHKTGNEWWVEVLVTHDGFDDLVGVDAQDEHGQWIALELRSWGAWAKSFHIEPGHDVRFRGHFSDGVTVQSCWFSHPSGAEKCRGPVEEWNRRVAGSTGGGDGGQMTMGDADHDGQEELYLATNNGIRVYAIDAEGTWVLEDTIAPGRAFGHLDEGDADNDGIREVVATSAGDLYVYEWTGTTWDEQSTDANIQLAITVGDVDGDGLNAIFGGTFNNLYRIKLAAGVFTQEELPTTGFGAEELWIGDADDDGDLELVTGGGGRGDNTITAGDFAGAIYSETTIDGAHGSSDVTGVAVADTDGDGVDEVFAARISPPGVWQSTPNGDGTWTTERVVVSKNLITDLFVADGDGDGRAEVYVAEEVHFTTQPPGTWIRELDWNGVHFDDRTISVGPGDEVRDIVAGDPDGDGSVELIVSMRDDRENPGETLYELSKHPFDGGTTPGPTPSPSATFDSKNGNEWWVQVRVTGASPSRVQAMDTGDPWVELTLRDWGDWAQSFRVEPGHEVRFRAMVDGTWETSCWFTHPEGKTPDGGQTCGGAGGETPPPSDFDASFQTPGGNEWWVEVYVDGNEPIVGVDARDDGGAWIALEKRDWGAWAKSFRVENGSIVEFRAHSNDGDTDISGGYVWPSGTPA